MCMHIWNSATETEKQSKMTRYNLKPVVNGKTSVYICIISEEVFSRGKNASLTNYKVISHSIDS